MTKKKEELAILPDEVPAVATSQGLMSPAQVRDFRIRMEKFTARMNEEPPMVVKHKQGYEYVPISYLEKDMFKQFFGLVQYELVEQKQIFNEVCSIARIKVFHPVLNQWLCYDGAGSAVIQQDANTAVSDFHLYKKSNAMQLTYPKAYAEAIKNAAKKIGKRFGADLNRKIEDDYEGQYPSDIKLPSEEDLEKMRNSKHSK